MKQEAVATIIKDPQVDQSGSSLPSLNQHDLPAVSFTQNFDQPIVETTNFENRHELLIHFGELHANTSIFFGLVVGITFHSCGKQVADHKKSVTTGIAGGLRKAPKRGRNG